MFFRFYVYASREEDALTIYHDCVYAVRDYMTEIQELKAEPYWKFSDMYVVELSVKLHIEKELFQTFLESISDDWEQFGLPANEMLASDTSPTCLFMKNTVGMVCIDFEEEESYLIPEPQDREYEYRSIKKISFQGILFDDGYFMDFELCRSHWAEKNNISQKETSCVAARNILAPSPLFLFYADTRITIYFQKDPLRRWKKNFHKLRFAIEEFGFSTFDMT